MKLLVFVIVSVILINCVISTFSNQPSTLKLVHLIFRHGERTPAKFYPNNPYNNVSYAPYGRGELTKFGQQEMYELGKKIRQRYNLFLNDLYIPGSLEATSSFISRTQISLQLFLHGLFPLPAEYRFDPEVDYQPIPYNVVSKETDEIFTTSEFCPKFYEALNRYLETSEYHQKELSDRDDLNYIEKQSGLKMRSYHDIFKIVGTLKAEQRWGLTLPAWTVRLFPKKFKELLFKGYQLMSANKELTTITAGGLIRKLTEDTLKKINKNASVEHKKMIIYSGHDITVGGLLGALEVLSIEVVPDYAAHMIIELHYLNKTYGFKFFYAAALNNNITELKIPNCKEFCSIQQFIELTKDYIPGPEICRAKESNTHYSWMLFITCSFMAMFYIILFVCLIKYKKALKCTKRKGSSEELRNLSEATT